MNLMSSEVESPSLAAECLRRLNQTIDNLYFFESYSGNPDPCNNPADVTEMMKYLAIDFYDLAAKLEIYRACMFSNGLNWKRVERAFDAEEEAETDTFCEKMKEIADTLTEGNWTTIRRIAEGLIATFRLGDIIRGKNIYHYPVGETAAREACRKLIAWHDAGNEDNNGQSD